MRNLVNVMREKMNAGSNENVRELASAGFRERLLYIPEFTIFFNAPVSHNQNFIQLHQLLNNIM